MHPYDFPADTETVYGSRENYYEFIDTTYFDVCKNSRVLEVAPFMGDHTKLLLKHEPSYVECIEGNSEVLSILKKIQGIDKIVIDDVWLRMDVIPFDVVVCFGLLYHHHSPLHLLELFVNLNTPKHIMLDCVTAEHPLAYIHEEINIPGSRQVRLNWKHCGLNLKPPFFIVNLAMSNMGYTLKKVHKLQTEYYPKSNGWVAHWEIN